MRILIFLFFFLLSVPVTLIGQIAANTEHFTVFDGKGGKANLNAIISSLGEYDVVFLGELHDDAAGHAIQAEIFRTTVEQFSEKRRVTLSLEMFERDVQP